MNIIDRNKGMYILLIQFFGYRKRFACYANYQKETSLSGGEVVITRKGRPLSTSSARQAIPGIGRKLLCFTRSDLVT